MFPEDRSPPEDSILKKLADAMTDVPANPVNVDRNGGELKIDDGDNQHVPSGFTYLGQFIDHDITLDLTSLGTRLEDPNATRNFRTPRLDLDSLYGLGPDGSPYLYERTRAAPNTALGPPSPKFLLGKNRTMDVPAGEFQNDLPRNSQGCALTGDHRNDENLIVAQTHLAFLKFHNKVVTELTDRSTPSETVFAEARRIVTWHYQWIVLYDFLERLTEQGIVATILANGRKFYQFGTTPYMVKKTGRGVPTIGLRIDYHSPAMPGDLTIHGKVVHMGSQFSVSEARVFDAQGKLLASGRGTYYTAPPKG